MSVTCQICKIRPAQIHYTEIVNDNMVTLNLCPACAEQKGIEVQQNSAYGLGDLVAGLIDTTVGAETGRIGRVTCPECSYEFSDFKKIGRFGCPDCYEAFAEQLAPMLRHIHGNTRHTGAKPAQPARAVSRLERRRLVGELKEELARAVEVEDYERAATIRDEIREMEAGMGGAGKTGGAGKVGGDSE